MPIILVSCEGEFPHDFHQLQVENLNDIGVFQLNRYDLRVQLWDHELVTKRKLVLYELFNRLVDLDVPVASVPLINILENGFHYEVVPLVLKFSEQYTLNEINLIKV